MVDYQKIETFRALGDKQGKIELEKYALEVGAVVKRSMSFDNMVKTIEDALAAKEADTKEPIVEQKPESTEEIKQEVIETVPVEVIEEEIEEESPIVQSSQRKMAFDVVGDKYPWAWNMSNVNDSYWFSSIDSAQYADLKSEKSSDFKKFVAELMKKSDMRVVVREPRNSMFVHISPDGIHESSVIYL
ncbi:hypothetical protein phiAS5_ORF0028 [Aeromonas phage phiAS5]|uniref:Inh N-terminal domain-containing protein n=1 Tax=Aeromonas phage phiAS5 TaxID=879630 RepID=E1A2C5_9CAUD|nr:hypothetical protein phiAS5_ORF0028 [Aeromonas phage phiAS5]ADM79871.1 hypothetical protein phiAS5_ORF0028 [Aeromonas phage phiAS5]BES53023.1 hypothetical protein [Aeromonas phage phiWae14]